MTDHTEIEELLSARALGGLDPQDEAMLERALTSHGADCAECRLLETELGEAAGRLAFALEPAPVRDGAEGTLLARALGRPGDAAFSGVSAAPAIPLDARRARRSGGRWRGAAAVAAAAVLFVGGYLVRDLSAPAQDEPPLAGARVVSFEGAQGSLSVAYQPGRAGVLIVGSDLPAPPERMVYEVWMIQGDAKVPGPCLEPNSDGSLFAYAEAELGTTDTMAVTVEPASCPTTPTSEPIFTADLSVA